MFSILKRMQRFSQKRVDDFGAQDTLFATFSLIFFMMPHYAVFNANLVAQSVAHQNLVLSLRAVGGTFCFLLLMKPLWPKSLMPYYPLFWHFSLFFTLPFLSTFLSLYGLFTLSGFFLMLFLLAVLVDWLSFSILTLLGICFALSVYFAVEGFKIEVLAKFDNSLVVVAYAFVVLMGVIFFRNREKATQDRISAMKTIGSAIAHEMRTPLASINISSSVLKSHLPAFIDGYLLAQKQGLNVSSLAPAQVEAVRAIPNRLGQVCQSSLLTIDMLLMLGSRPKEVSHFSKSSISDCVEAALCEYAFLPKEREFVTWEKGLDFEFMGSRVLVVHILFNLLKNSLYFIKDNPSGSITVRCEQKVNTNQLLFEDTAVGISSVDLPHIFGSSFSKSKHGTGLGLNFCKKAMESMGGKISCYSKLGEYTKFVLQFPKIEERRYATDRELFFSYHRPNS